MRATVSDLPLILDGVSLQAGATTILDRLSLSITPGAPTRNEVPTGTGTTMYSGWFKWYYARQSYAETSGDNGNWGRSWVLIGDDRGFFLINSSGYQGDWRVQHAFTDFDSVSISRSSLVRNTWQGFSLQMIS